jgi:transposase InsO family protein
MKFSPIQLAKDLLIKDAGSKRIPIKGYYNVILKISDVEYKHKFYIIENLACAVILGMDFVSGNGLIIDGQEQIIRMQAAGDHLFLIERTTPTPLIVSHDSSIPPYSFGPIRINAHRHPDADLYAHGSDINFACVLHTDKHGRGHLIALNHSAESINIKRGESITTAEPFKDSAKENPRVTTRTPAKRMSRHAFISKFSITCPPELKEDYSDLLYEFQDTFSLDDLDIGRNNLIPHQIKLKDNAPVFTKQFRIPLSHQDTINKFVDEMLDKNLIEATRSNFNSPIFCVKKKNGTWRPVVDLRRVNAATLKDAYSIKDVRSCLDTIGKHQSSVFSTIDLKHGFFQQELEINSRPMTSFTVPGRGQFQFKVSCFGSTGAPSSFSKLMDSILQGLDHTVSYIDDILIYSASHSDHLGHLRKCFVRLRQNNLKMSIEKSVFGAANTEYLGFRIDAAGIRPGTDKLQSVRDFAPPAPVRQIRQFVGLASFFREHIPNFSTLGGYLTALTRKDSKWSGGALPSNALIAFQTLKKSLITSPAIAYPRFDLPYTLLTDAAAGSTGDDGSLLFPGGLGAALLQLWPQDNNYRVIAYASRALKTHEKNYSAFMLELSAIHFGIKHFHHYLYGGKAFLVYTDHKPLEALNRNQTKTINRLQEELLEYDFEIKYKKGSEMQVADFLSRNPINCLSTTYSGSINEISIITTLRWNEILCSAEIFDPTPRSPVDLLGEEPDVLKQLQRDDPSLLDIINYLEEDSKIQGRIPRYSQDFRLDKGILWIKRVKNYVLVIPKSLHNLVLAVAHDSAIGGHRNALKTQDRITNSYWWPGLFKDIQTYIRQCHICQTKNNPHSKASITAPLHPLPITSRFNDRVSMDLLGPLKSVNQYTYVLVITDAFTKWVELVAVADKSATSIANAFFDTWICRYSVPKTLLSDNGKEFCNSILKELNEVFKIHHIKTSPYHPQTNAASERFNRTFISYLRSYITDKEQSLDWTSWLPVAQLSYNTQVHASTKFTPYFLLHFHDPQFPNLTGVAEKYLYSASWPAEAILRLNNAWKSTKQTLQKASILQKKYYDQKTNERHFELGELVLLKKMVQQVGANNKFIASWLGPFVIMKVISSTNVIIRQTPHSKERLVHVNNLKHYIYNTGSPGYLEVDADLQDDTDVEDISTDTPVQTPEETSRRAERRPQPYPAPQPGRGRLLQRLLDSELGHILSPRRKSSSRDPSPSSRVLRSAGPVKDIPLPDFPVEYRPSAPEHESPEPLHHTPSAPPLTTDNESSTESDDGQ